MIKKTMSGLLLVVFITALLLFTSSCQPKPPKVEPGPSAEEQARIEKEKAEEQARIEREKAEEQARIEREKAEQAAAEKEAVESEKIYFDYDSSELKSESQEALTKKAEWLKANEGYNLRIEGNCDSRGSTEYNLALGSRRAEAAEKFLNALGVAADRITTKSNGEDNPAVEGNNETAWEQNRRDEFVLIQ